MQAPEHRFPLASEWHRIQELPRTPAGEPLLAVGSVPYAEPYACYPLRIEWEITQPAREREAFPKPLRTSEDPIPTSGIPTPVLKLQRAAEGAGWSVTLTAAEGFVPHSTTGRPSAVPKESYSLRMTRGRRSAVAVRMGATWQSFWDWSDQQFFRRSSTLAEFQERIMSEPVGAVGSGTRSADRAP